MRERDTIDIIGWFLNCGISIEIGVTRFNFGLLETNNITIKG